MKSFIIHNVTAILPNKLLPDARVVVQNGRIAEISASSKRVPKDAVLVDGQGGYLSQGFVDVHVHGGGGGDFMDGTTDAVRVACQTHFKHGTTTMFPTTTTGTPEEIHAMIAAWVRYGHRPPAARARPCPRSISPKIGDR